MPGIFDEKDTMEHTKPLGVAGAGMLASVPVSVGAGLGGHALAKHLFQQMETGKYGPRESNPEVLAQKLLREGGRSPADIKKFKIDTGAHPMGPHYAWGKREHLQLPKRLSTPMVVSHEVGHASATNPASKALRLLRGNRITPLLPLGLLVGGSLAGDRDATEMNLAQKAALPAAVVQALATHGEELRASLVGKNLLKRLGRETPHFWKQLLGTQGTYALGNAAAIAPILGGTLALKKVMERRKAARGIKKTSAELADSVLRRMGTPW